MFMQIAIISIFKSYPTVGDIALYMAFLPVWNHLYRLKPVCPHEKGFLCAIMRAQYVFLFVYWVSGSDSTSQFLQCAGVPSGPLADPQHLHNLLRLVDATLDVYSFMRSALSQGPALELWAGIEVTPQGLVSEADVLKVWLEVKMKPLLSSVSRQFLRCLGNKNLSCEAYQTVVRELSHHFSAMDSSRQKWIYMFFMYPFLSDNRTAGCMHLSNSSEDWLMRNFGSFSVKATMKDLSSLNMVFSGLEVLHLLTPEQRAELLLQPGVAGLDDGALSLVFNSLLQSLMPGRPTPPPPTTTGPIASFTGNQNQTHMNTVQPNQTPTVREVANGFLTFLKPAGSFARNFVAFTKQHNLTTMRSATLIQAVLNLTLAELAAPYKQKNQTTQNQVTFDPLDVNDWFQHAVVPVLRRYLPRDQMEIPENITAVFHNLFHIQNGLDSDSEETDVDSDVCSVSIDKRSCALTDAVEEVARVMHCAVKTNLSLTEETLMQLVMELSSPLNSLMRQLMNMNFSSPNSPFFGILDKLVPGPLTQENLDDVTFIQLWFQIKLRPLLPSMTPEYLSCLSAKRFSCEAYQALVQALGDHMTDMHEGGPEMVLQNFLIPYLSNPNTSDPGCVGSAENSTDWMEKNMGRFSPLATLVDMYSLNPHFSAMEVVARLSPRQMAELMVSPLPRLPPKAEVVERVFGHLLMDPEERDLPDVLTHLVRLSHNMVMDCESYQIIVEKLYDVLWSVPRMMEPEIWATIHNLRQPPESRICAGVNSSELQRHLEAGNVPCEYTLTEYACSQLRGFTAQHLAHLLVCKLSSNMTYSRETWKLLLTKTSAVLDEALIIFSHMVSNMSVPVIGPSVSHVLDVLGELRLDFISDLQWNNISFISSLFGQSLRPFLPFASGSILQCVSSKNLTCDTYQHIVSELSHQFDVMGEDQAKKVLSFFIQPFLSRNSSGPGCISNNSMAWLLNNYGRFSAFVPLTSLLDLNKQFNPLSVLELLSPQQKAELILLPLQGLPHKEEVIRVVFSHLLQSPVERQMPEVLHHLTTISAQNEIPCFILQSVSENLFLALSSVPLELEHIIYTTADHLKANSPQGCILPPPPSLTAFTAQHLAHLLVCKLPSNMTYSRETWKLLLTKTSAVLDEALIMFSSMVSNESVPVMGPSVSHVLDVVGELRLDLISDLQLNNISFISSLFGQSLRPFLPFASGNFLQCVSSKNLTCDTYQHIVSELSHQFDVMGEDQAKKVLSFFIQPFLSRNSSGPGCISNNSMAWLLNNFGRFSAFVPLTSLLDLNKQFNPLSVLELLSPQQKAELILLPLQGLPHKDEVIRVVFGHLMQSPVERQMPEVLHHLTTISAQNEIPCFILQSVSENLFLALSSVPLELEHIIYTTADHLKANSPQETEMCNGINSSELQHHLDAGNVACQYSVSEYACAQLTAFTAQHLAHLLVCKLPSNMTYSRETWKLLLTKTSAVLDEALIMFSSMVSNESVPVMGPSVSHVLDVVGELRLDLISDLQLNNISFISSLFGQSLRPFLPFASGNFLQCVSSKNLTCDTYQHIVSELSHQFDVMGEDQAKKVLSFFIQPFLSRNSSGPGCISNNSMAWLLNNYGRFSAFVPLTSLLDLNKQFNPLSVLELLSPQQKAELILLPLQGLPHKEEVIRVVFTHLLQSPVERQMPEVLRHLTTISAQNEIPCFILQSVSENLFLALSSVPLELEHIIYTTADHLKANSPQETEMCNGINSSELQHHLDAGNVACQYSVSEYACAQLTAFTAQHLAHLLVCKLPSNMTYSRETWKLLLTKTSAVLDEALIMFSSMVSNESVPVMGPSVSHVLDVVGELRLDLISDLQLNNISFISSLFGQSLRPFLPFASGNFLQCVSSKNLTCDTYQHIVSELSHQFDVMGEDQAKKVLSFFIQPFLSRNSSGPGCISNNSMAWLLNNYGRFSAFVPLTSLLDLNKQFNPLSFLELLSPQQKAELILLPLQGLPHKEEVIRVVFSHLIQSPVERQMPEVLHHLTTISAQNEIPCFILQSVSENLFLALSSVPLELEHIIYTTADHLKANSPQETEICNGINSSELQHHLDAGNVACQYSVSEYACAQLTAFTAQHLAHLLVCKLTSNMTYSRETWKLLLTKTSAVLDEALIMFSSMVSNQSVPVVGPSVSHVLDVVGELRLDLISDLQWNDISFISSLFGQSLRPFLPFASGNFLQCVSSKNLTCDTYQHIVSELSHQFDVMGEDQAKKVLSFFIQPFLSRNSSGPGCISNNSMAWLLNNYGRFSAFVPLTSLLDLNKQFNPLSVLELLSPQQKAELILLPLQGLPHKEEVIRVVFTHLLQSPVERQMPEVLHHLTTISAQNEIPCLILQSVSENLFLALSSVPLELEHIIYTTADHLKANSPQETEICNGINSSELQHHLDAGNVACQYSVSEYACAQLAAFTAQQLADLLVCKLTSNMTYSRETWKLLLTKTSAVLDEALIMFSSMVSNESVPVMGPSVSHVLDVVGELRLDLISDLQWNDISFISSLFGQSLWPFLPFASGNFLQCVSSKNLTCDTYQHIVSELSHQFDVMGEDEAKKVLSFFIQPFLSRNSSGPGCISNNSMAWLLNNYGRFSAFVPLTSLLDLNKQFNPLSVLELLSPQQKAELILLPLQGLPHKEEVIRVVFTHLLQSPVERQMPEVLHHLTTISAQNEIPCLILQSVSENLFLALSSVPLELEHIIYTTADHLKAISPQGCILPPPPSCSLTKLNETEICNGINSSELQHHLDAGNVACQYSVSEYACAQLTAFTAQHLAHLLVCKLPSNMTYSRETWKLLLTKTSAVLDEALIMFSSMVSNESVPVMGPSVSHVLDVVGELRLDLISDLQLNNISFISSLFGQSLRPFLPFASGNFLQCVSSKNLTCDTYQHIVSELSHQFDVMGEDQAKKVLSFFIQPFLSRNSSGPGCISNNSMAWLLNNYGRFSAFVPLTSLLDLNKQFNPLSVLELLSPQQKAELILLPLQGLPHKEEVIRVVFSHLLQSPVERQMPEVLHHLTTISAQNEIPCFILQSVSENLFLALSSVPLELEHIIYTTADHLKANSPQETEMCNGINSSELQHHLDAGNVACQYSVSEYACAQLTAFTAQHLAHLLVCKLPSNMTYSRETWKLLLTKTSAVLDEALIMFSSMVSNESVPVMGPSVSHVLDVVGELRLDLISDLQWNDISFISSLFGQSLRPFLSFASGNFLQCVSSKNLTCDTYQHIVSELSHQFDVMGEDQAKKVLSFFIQPFLSRNSSGPGCIFNNSMAWLLNNYGRFSAFVPLTSLLDLNKQFSPLSVLELLSPQQKAELILLPLQGLPHKEEVIRVVFTHLLQSPVERQMPEVLHHLTTISAQNEIPCLILQSVSENLFLALSSVPLELEHIIYTTADHLKANSPQGCILPPPPSCSLTKLNETEMCNGINSSELQHHLDAGNVACQYSVSEYACAQLTAFTAQHLAHLLVCKLPSNMTYSRETWKLLLTKTSAVLDEALIMFSSMVSNESVPVMGPSVSHVLDVVGELRLDLISDLQWNDISFISSLFGQSLWPFLPFASGNFLQCVSSKNLTCDTYQHIVSELSHQFDVMGEDEAKKVLSFFIQPFLSRNSSGPGCISNNSMAWLLNNYGRFSAFVPLTSLLDLNKQFNPLSVLELLSPQQKAELILLPLQGLPPKEEVIRVVFSHLLQSPVERQMPEVLRYLTTISAQNEIPCGTLQSVSENLFLALSYVPLALEHIIYTTADHLRQNSPQGCRLPPPPSCPFTKINESEICVGINSSDLQHHLDAGNVACQYSVSEYACAQLRGFTAQHLADLLVCKLSSNMTYSTETWKLLLTKTSAVLDEALITFSHMASNMSLPVFGPSMSAVLDVLGETRLDRFEPDSWWDADFISSLFGESLRPFLPFASRGLFHCISSKNLTCQTYQHILDQFSHVFSYMDDSQRQMVAKYFIQPFLSKNSTGACASNNSADWLKKNFGPFSVFTPVPQLLSLNPQFSPVAVVEVLSPQQLAELMVLPMPGLPDREQLINTVFDHLLSSPSSPTQNRLPQVLESVTSLTATVSLDCRSYQAIFKRLNGILTSSPGALEPVVWASIYDLTSTAPAGCDLFMVNDQCPITPHNESVVCSGVNSDLFQQSLAVGNVEVCNFSVSEIACASLESFTVDHLVRSLQCHLPRPNPEPGAAWKLLLTKTSAILDQALHVFSNQTESIQGPSVPVVLDVIREVQLDRFLPEELQDSDFLSEWFIGRLRPFLSSASPGFLSCISSKNLSCGSYQHVLQAFSRQLSHMSPPQRGAVLHELITPFLSRTGSACMSNDSAAWLQSNLGPFSVLVNTSLLLQLNGLFKPLEVLDVLSPGQLSELMVAPLPGLSDKDDVINRVFNFLAAAPEDRKLPEVLQGLVTLSGQPEIIPCSSYKLLFKRMDQLIPVVSVLLEMSITSAKTSLLTTVPPGCVIYSGECNVTPINETDICLSINSTALQHLLDSQQVSRSLCAFSIPQYACAELTALTAEDLVTLFTCKMSEDHPKQTWKLFITKANHILGHALDLFNSTTLTDSPAVSHILDAIGEVSFSSFSTEHVRDVAYVKRWFQTRLRPFLPFVTAPFLSCLATKNFSCHTYQSVVQTMGNDHGKMANSTQIKVYTDFIEVFLSDKADSGCTAGVANTADWLEKNFGPFSAAASVVDLQRLHGSFSLMEALPRLTLGQLLEASVTPGLLSSPAETTTLLQHVPDPLLASYFTSLAPAAQGVSIAAPIRSAMLQQVFDRANLSKSSVPDNEVLVWLNDRLAFLLPNLSPTHVGPYFDIIRLRQCGTSQQAVALLNSTLATLPDDTQTLVYSHIIRLLTEPSPLRCYVNGSFYSFLETTFMGFQFPNLTTFLALLPAGRTQELVNSMPPAHLGSFLSRPGTVDDTTKLCQIFDAYTHTPPFLATENVPEAIQPSILPCVWPRALASSSASEADLWFDVFLSRYLRYLNKNLISSSALRNTHCLAFRKFVAVMGNRNYSSSGFTLQDVYSTLLTYLSEMQVSAPKPRCFNASNPQLASTSWFVDYVGVFIQFISLEDLNAFGGASLQPFTTNLANLQLFNQTALPPNVSSFYVELLYQQDPTFNPIHLPLAFRCSAPAVAFANLTLNETTVLSDSLFQTCSQIDSDVSAALSSNVETISPTCISMLGNSSTGFSTGQLSAASPTVIFSSLSVLSTVVGWNHGQAVTLVQKLITSGSFTITSSRDLQMLGTLISGVPTSTINAISTSEILTASQSSAVISNLVKAPTIIQQTFVSKIISADSSVGSILTNVPSELSTQIPRNFLQGFSGTTEVVTKLNQKQWTAVLVFDTVVNGTDNSNEISFQVLQGFTCTRVESLTKAKVKSLIKGCRRRKNLKLTLKQTQLTCMYYYLRDEADATDYSLFPADVLLYYNYSMVTNCVSYFTELGNANFNVLSDVLEYRKTILVTNAKTCLGITGTSLSAANVNILGNMVCILDGSYVQNSDPSILENLKGCDDLTDSLVSGMETLLLSGNTTYGAPSAWTEQTLKDLGILPLYFTSNIWNEVPKRVGRKYLKMYIKQLRNDDVPRKKIRELKTAFRSDSRSKRDATTECTVGTITQVQIHDDTFPIDYDTTQFDACLSIATLKDNLAAITDRADEVSYHKIILKKLNQAYPEGISDDVVQMLGPASRGASIDDISKWNVTKIDTLSILMKSSDGEWSTNQTKAIMAKYLAAGNSMDSSALNAVGGLGLCALDSSVLEGISSNSLRQADALTISSCSLAKKKSLFPIAQEAFISQTITKRATTTVTATQYQLIQSYLGGATESFVQTLAASNIGMDISTFLGLDQSVIQTLSVSNVRNLLGSTNVNDLSTYSSNAIIQDWISRQYQSDLDTLNLGLTGGRSTPSTAAPTTVNGNAGATNAGTASTGTATTTVTTTTTTAATRTTTGNATTGSGGASVRPAHGLHCLLLAIVASALCLLQ
ncbi:hypothetical protein ACEWY4_017577 [Coilia grayii]|uniref:Uncharacterized protein n=1 Tax=Coilia grayii TaxID=363190 RepID=A0ABD1JHA6_9TELE